MSNSLAIAAVTATLRNLLTAAFSDLAGTSISVKHPDKAPQPNDSSNQINLFLYHSELDAAWRNRDMPQQVRPGESGHPPLPLKLCYLVTAYGLDDDDVAAHRLLGRAMGTLHDHPVLGRTEI